MKTPLVSVLIPNYNHSKYLKQCIESAINQSYENLEIIVLDNASTDDSVQIGVNYLYDKRVKVCKNTHNILNGNYRVLTECLASGKYFILLCADDYLHPEFIERAVTIMENNSNVAYVQGEKDFVYGDGTVIDWDPFYRCSFIAPGRNVMPIYMVTTVAHPAQGVIRRSAFIEIDGYDKEIDHMNADRTLWFYLSYNNDMAYIRETMSYIRVGNETETFITQRNFQHPILCHLTIKDFAKYAKEKNLPDVYKREEEAYERLTSEFLNYAIGMIRVNEFDVAEKYCKYAYAILKSVADTEKYREIMECIIEKNNNLEKLEKYGSSIIGKKHGYEPPKDYQEITINKDY